MIATVMFFSLGFLAASLLTLIIVPLVHDRAERLALRRIEASIPQSVAEVHAGKDQLGAEFAMSTRRLELTIEKLRANIANLFSELGKKNAAIDRLEAELGAKAAAVFTPTRPRSHGGDDGLPAKPDARRAAAPMFAGREAEVAKLRADLDERSRLADTQRIEIVALKIQVDALKDRVADPAKQRPGERIDPARRLRLAS